ncbi:MAG: hypothetical protein R3208_04040 [Ketobacteraceae bacterium]|nr:hypothetical protein [Ketobacteraceae bacterium]
MKYNEDRIIRNPIFLAGFLVAAGLMGLALPAQAYLGQQIVPHQINNGVATYQTRYYEITHPTKGSAPYPVVLLFHGTGENPYVWSKPDWKPNYVIYRNWLLSQGYAVITPDSRCLNDPLNINTPSKYWQAWHYQDPAVNTLDWGYAHKSADWEGKDCNAALAEDVPDFMLAYGIDKNDRIEMSEGDPGNEDLRFIRQIIQNVIAEAPHYDAQRIHLAGFSNGGMFAIWVARFLTGQPLNATENIQFASLVVQGAGGAPFEDLWHDDTPNHPPTWLSRFWNDYLATFYSQESVRSYVAGQGYKACRGMDWHWGYGHDWSNEDNDIILDLMKTGFANYTCGSNPIHDPQ